MAALSSISRRPRFRPIRNVSSVYYEDMKKKMENVKHAKRKKKTHEEDEDEKSEEKKAIATIKKKKRNTYVKKEETKREIEDPQALVDGILKTTLVEWYLQRVKHVFSDPQNRRKRNNEWLKTDIAKESVCHVRIQVVSWLEKYPHDISDLRRYDAQQTKIRKAEIVRRNNERRQQSV